MTSFIANTFCLISHKPETVFALLATTRPFMNSSVVPVTLSNDELWDDLCSKPFAKEKEERFLRLFSLFSDTMQFTEKLRFHHGDLDPAFTNDMILKHLIENKRYFARTLKQITFPNSDSIALCCANLRNISNIDLRFCKETFHNADLKLICENFNLLEKLDLSSNHRTNAKGLVSMSNLTSLTELDVSDSYVRTLPFLKHLKRLRRLRVGNSDAFMGDLAFKFAEISSAVADNNNSSESNLEEQKQLQQQILLPSLTHLELLHKARVTSVTFSQLNVHAPNLFTLSVDDPDPTDCKAIMGIISLERLSILFRKQLFNTDCAAAFSIKHERLRHVQLDICQKLDDATLALFGSSEGMSSFPIRRLKLDTCGRISNEVGFRALASLQFLEELDFLYHEWMVSNILEIGEDKFFSKTLKDLKISSCDPFSNRGLKATLKRLSLRSLTVSCCEQITSEGLHDALATSHSKESLEILDVRRCKNVIKDICFMEGLASLKKLNLSGTKLDFELMREKNFCFVATLSSSSPVLEELELSSLEITDLQIVLFPLMLSNLKLLDVSWCRNLTDEALIKGISKLKYLETLRLDGETQFTLPTIKSSIGNLRRLKQLAISNELYAGVKDDVKFTRKYGHLIIDGGVFDTEEQRQEKKQHAFHSFIASHLSWENRVFNHQV